jgi:hypothetical protein
MYLANSTWPYIAFAVNLLARYIDAPTKCHWVGVKNVFWYLNGTKGLGLFFKRNNDQTLIGYVDVVYLSDPHEAKSQTWFVLMHGRTVISWKSSKWTMVAKSTNHSEIIALFEASRDVHGFTEWYTIYLHLVVLVHWNHQPLSMKIMLLLLFRWKQVMLRLILTNIWPLNYSFPMDKPPSRHARFRVRRILFRLYVSIGMLS